tara:strand:- start:42 stop:218 length:177 start_codon:yes stop_codon:yes gene_type:complete
MGRGTYKGPQGYEGLVPSKWDKNGKPIEWREEDPEGWYKKMQVKGKNKKTKLKRIKDV